MNVAIFGELNAFELLVLSSLMPAVFIYLWTLITGDIKNFENSKIAYSVYTAKDPINCYQNYTEKKKDS
ncbi:uncharacterized protein LOC115767494 [Drosophila novamexicana]|uniref:Uncharacterized protein n=1 Tax=Drosophila virilis TaxID=7244 RepID=B4LIJ2_DROVI|nr:uncharacterized protein LOC6625048 [Drosophila virilis]XP_030567662.1 uncharacterized protein LOC115767494 [Drosophila novamexicana]EDW60362.1 uncharacterized protein Dvir_GJ21433 [Drosophila virilis]